MPDLICLCLFQSTAFVHLCIYHQVSFHTNLVRYNCFWPKNTSRRKGFFYISNVLLTSTNMAHDDLSTLLVGRLTRLLELNSLEELKVLEECGYVKQNMEVESKGNFNVGIFYENHEISASVTSLARKSLFRTFSRRGHESGGGVGFFLPRKKLKVIIALIDYLKSNADTDGLFRISGNRKRQLELKVLLDKEVDINYGIQSCACNTHDIAGILKEYIGELKEPLLTKQLYYCYLQLSTKFKTMDSEFVSEQRKLEALKTLFLLLPPINRYLLKKLIELLAIVAANPDNRMDASNLSVVFTPNICTRQVTGCTEFTDSSLELFTGLIKFIIENSEAVFKVPEDFLKDVKYYEQKVSLNEAKAGDVPLTHSFCHQIESKEFRKEGMANTNEAIVMLYQQIQDMSDGPKKKDFITKFHQSYPGTPVFVPKKVRDAMSSPCQSLYGSPTPSLKL